MKSFGVFFAFSLLLSSYAFGGEKKIVHLTGNPNVDFFSMNILAATFADTDKPMIYSTTLWQEEVKDEKSPWLAGVMSLAVPGAGEIYAESYIKGAAFFAAEAASWILRFTYNKKGDDQEVLFKEFANQHYSAVRYTNWTLDHLTSLNANTPYNSAQYTQRIYGSVNQAPNDSPPPFGAINWVELNNMERDIANGSLNGFTHALPYYGEQQYYELIGKYEQFSRGWDDSDPNDPLETAVPVKTTSKRFREYAEMRAKANDYYDVASAMASVIVINHIVSAVDAFWSVTRYNKALHASVKLRVQPSPVGYIPVTEASIRYDF